MAGGLRRAQLAQLLPAGALRRVPGLLRRGDVESQHAHLRGLSLLEPVGAHQTAPPDQQ